MRAPYLAWEHHYEPWWPPHPWLVVGQGFLTLNQLILLPDSQRERERDEGRGKKRNLLLPFVAYNVVVGSIGRGPDVTTLPFDRPRRNIPFLLLTRPACCKEGREQVVTVAGLQRAQ